MDSGALAGLLSGVASLIGAATAAIPLLRDSGDDKDDDHAAELAKMIALVKALQADGSDKT